MAQVPDNIENLSPNFKTKEFFVSGEKNVTPQAHLVNMGLVEKLERARALWGDKEVKVISGFRSPSHPIESKKRKPGTHSHGLAGDVIPPIDPLEAYELLEADQSFQDAGVGLYYPAGSIHIDSRGERARWGFIKQPDGSNKQVPIEEVIELFKKDKKKTSYHQPDLNFEELLTSHDPSQEFQQSAKMEDSIRMELGHTPTSQLQLVADAVELVVNPLVKADNRNRGTVGKVLALSGLARSGISPEDIPDELPPDKFMTDVLGIEQEILDLSPFNYDESQPLIPQIQEWLSGVVKLDKAVRSKAINDLIGEGASGSGLILGIGQKTFNFLKNIGRAFKRATSVDTELREVHHRIKEMTNISKLNEDLIAYHSNPGGARAQRIKEVIESGQADNTLFKAMERMPNEPISDVTSAILNLRATEYYEEIMVPLARQYRGLPDGPDKEKVWSNFLESFAQLGRLRAPQVGGVSATARTMVGQQFIEELTVKQMMDNIDKVVKQGVVDRDTMMDNFLKIPSIAEQMNMARKLARPGAWKRYNEILISGMLSGPSTWMGVNPMSTLTNTIAWLTKTQIGGLMPGNAIKANDAWEAVKAMAGAFRTELGMFRNNLVNPQIRFGKHFQKVDLEQFTLNPDTDLDQVTTGWRKGLKWLDFVAHRLSINLTVAQDELAKGAIFQGAIAMEANRVAKSMPAWKNLSGKARAQLRRDIGLEMHTNPHLWRQQIDRSRTKAGELTLTLPGGPTMEAAIELINSHPALKTILPFIRTPTNAFKITFNEAPVIGQIRDLARGKFTSKDPYVRAEAQAKAVAIAGLTAMVWQWAEEGSIMGAMGPDTQVRKAAIQQGRYPNSIILDTDGDSIGDTALQLLKGSPVANVVHLIASFQQAMPYLSKGQVERFSSALFLGLWEMVEQNPFLSQLGDMSELLKRASTSTNKGKDVEEWVKKNGMIYAVPTLFNFRRQIVGAMDPENKKGMIDGSFEFPEEFTYEAVKGTALHDLGIMWEMIKAEIPGMNPKITPQFDGYGEIDLPQGGFGPRDLDNNAIGRTVQAFYPLLAGTKRSHTSLADEKKFSIQQFMTENGRPLPLPPERYQGVPLDWRQQQAINIIAGRGKMPEEYVKWFPELDGVVLDNQTMEDELFDILLSEDDERKMNEDGTFRLTLGDDLLIAYRERQAEALDLLLDTELFKGVREAAEALKDAEELEFHSPAITKPRGFGKPLLLR